ncbi:MAG: tagaturonate reductase [Bacteroidota bacterium]
MKTLNRSTHTSLSLTTRILQFGEGNFLRAFVDWMVHEMNTAHGYASGVAVIQPIDRGMVQVLAQQGGLYHHVMQGVEAGETVDKIVLNDSIQQAINPFEDEGGFFALAESEDVKLVFSNTTEAGIQFNSDDHPMDGLAITFPGKLTQWLHRRFEQLGDSESSELGVVPCELIEANGDKLKSCIQEYATLWKLGGDFQDWLGRRVHFANTLVDRIVPGYPKAEMTEIKSRMGFEDQLVVKSETFHLFVLEGDDFLQEHFPAHRYGFNVKYVDSIAPYRTQKVRILNGAHTSMVPVGLLSGLATVRETVEDPVVGEFVRQCIFDEIVPTISLPDEDPKVFAEQVLSRFANPFIRHELIAISLNSISKWRVRVLPTVLDFLDTKGTLPKRLVFSLAALIQLHLSGDFQLKDDEEVLAFFGDLRTQQLTGGDATMQVLKNESLWGQNLTAIDGFVDLVSECLESISTTSIASALSRL